MALCVRPGAPWLRCSSPWGSRCVRLNLHTRKTNNPFPTPPPARARPPLPLGFGLGAWAAGQLAAPPHSRGGLEITSSISFPHLYCMSDPDFGRLFAFSLTTIFPMPRYRFGIVKMHAREKVLRLRTPIHIMIH